MAEKKKGYDFLEVEARLKEIWEKEKTFKFDPKKKRIYSIDTPPPTVSGKMHIGHAFSYSQQDFIARFRRMFQGVYYPFGTDDNGLPTERLVEKLKNVKSTEMSRAEFIDLCLKTISEIRDNTLTSRLFLNTMSFGNVQTIDFKSALYQSVGCRSK